MPLLLLVEDDIDTRTALAGVLTSEGYLVCEAADCAGGLEALRRLKPDLVILDYGLPVIEEGAEFLRLKASGQESASIPVILVSGFKLPAEMDGVVVVVPKPYDLEELLSLVRRFAGTPGKPGATSGG